MLYCYNRYPIFLILLLITLVIAGCTAPSTQSEQALYTTHCGSCHMPPKIESLPRDIWEENILPDMAARMGISEKSYDPYNGMSFDERVAVMKTGIYFPKAVITEENWHRLRDYILKMAPDSLSRPPEIQYSSLTGFEEEAMAIDSIPGSKNITFLDYKKEENEIIIADLLGNVLRYDWDSRSSQLLGNFINPVVGFAETPLGAYATSIGQLSPTQIPTGRLLVEGDNGFEAVSGFFHRPVHMLVKDLDADGDEEIILSEFGDLVGKLTLIEKNGDLGYEKKVLLNLPGTIRVMARDMNRDGLTDLVVLTAQGEEGITIFYQEAPLQFRAERVLRFSPVFGTSWFDLLDYNGDGYEDIVTVNGDNADKSYVHKPYHGFRIHLNNGDNEFTEAFFYPLHGATRFVGRDFDQDGDMDFCLVATFPDYDKKPLLPFVYLQNEDKDSFEFTSQVLENPGLGRWLLIEAGDIDRDGDEDVLLSSFNYVFTPVPDSLNNAWKQRGTDMLILRNTLIDGE